MTHAEAGRQLAKLVKAIDELNEQKRTIEVHLHQAKVRVAELIGVLSRPEEVLEAAEEASA